MPYGPSLVVVVVVVVVALYVCEPEGSEESGLFLLCVRSNKEEQFWLLEMQMIRKLHPVGFVRLVRVVVLQGAKILVA